MGKMWAIRRFSREVSLFGTVATAADVPAREIMNHLDQTREFIRISEAKFAEYNANAMEEYDQMIQNQINAIVARNGIDEWELAEDNGFLRKTFTFATPETAHYFMNEVSKVCSKSDHHPEWKLVSDRAIEVHLTSHFAGNKVSINDYELAEAMNKIEKTSQSYNHYSYFTTSKIIEYIIGFVLVGFAIRGIKPRYPEVQVEGRDIHPLEYTENFTNAKVDQQLDKYSLEEIKGKILQ
eukprot:CAMPEP_0197004702 /NCGR_PEP_ID=MMETSP1380-20130617/25200_1 /TAXON_ID=5936 /ORGANISM="Euplotes crassus, Strain CT5" /LENGTH=237 /DNA_ID=CAMNT_0042423579 /DNA_START=38 /DNA_END=751 /DNA_ORIENTATION=+